MARISAPTVEGGGDFHPEQVTRIPNGLYGGLFAWYSLPKQYTKYNSTETEERFYCGFVVTHDRAYRELPGYSDAIIGIRPKRFYDAETGMKSSYIQLMYALLGGKKSYEELMELSDDELPDLDDMIGRPVTLFIEANTKPDKNGIYGRKVKGLEPADRDLIAAIKPLYAARETEVTEKGVRRLTRPVPAIEGAGAGAVHRNADDLEEIPF